MAYELKNGQGSIFRNTNKKEDKHPDYNGKIKTPDGKEWDLSLWVKDSKNGNKFFSVAVKEPYVKQDVTQPVQSNNSSYYNPNPNAADSLPF